MPIHFSCPRCHTEFHDIRREFMGKRVQCHCGEVLRLGPKPAGSSDSEVPVRLPSISQSTVPGETGRVVSPPHYAQPRAPAADVGQMTQIIDKDPLFGTPRQPNRPEHSFINPVSPEEKQRYIVTSIVPNYSTQPPGAVYDGVAASQANVEKYYQQLSKPRNNGGAALGIILGGLGTLQGVVIGLMSLVSSVRVFQAMSLVDSSSGTGLGDSLLIELLMLVVILFMNLGLGVFSGMMVFGCIEELNGQPQRNDQTSTLAFVSALYVFLVIAMACFLIFVMPEQAVAGEVAGRTWLATQAALSLTIGATMVAAIPLGLTIYGVIRSK